MVTYKYYPRPFANSICLKNIANSFREKGDSVDFLVYEDLGIETPNEHDGFNVYKVEPNLQIKLFYYAVNFPQGSKARVARTVASTISKIKKLVFLYWFPFDSFRFPKRICRAIEDLYENQHYDLIISAYAPFDIVLAGMWFKRKHSECKWCIYALDSFTNLRQTYLPERMRSAGYWMPKFLENTDLLIYMKSRERWFEDSRFMKWRDKLAPADIPLMTSRSPSTELKPYPVNVRGKQKWVYAGSLAKPHYNANALLGIFGQLPNDEKRELHFYSNGPEFDELKRSFKGISSKVYFHNYIDHEKLIEVYESADVLVSLKFSDQISAKIFEYMTYGKSILHLSGCSSDPDQQYIESYPRSLVLRLYQESDKSCVDQIMDWEQSLKDKQSYMFDPSVFEMNMPEYTRDLILSKLEMEN